MRILYPESLKYRAIREAVLWEDDNSAYRHFLMYMRAKRVANLLKARKRLATKSYGEE
ncbi:hypothetical protein [Candidatus Pyrohabitans sp.]